MDVLQGFLGLLVPQDCRNSELWPSCEAGDSLSYRKWLWDIAAVFLGVQPGRLHTRHFTPGCQLGFPDPDARAAPL